MPLNQIARYLTSYGIGMLFANANFNNICKQSLIVPELNSGTPRSK